VADHLRRNRKIRRPTKESKHCDAVVTAPKAGAPKRRRRTTPEFVAQVRELIDRGLGLTAVGDALNISDRRVRQLAALYEEASMTAPSSSRMT
jgi:hypothetical protein